MLRSKTCVRSQQTWRATSDSTEPGPRFKDLLNFMIVLFMVCGVFESIGTAHALGQRKSVNALTANELMSLRRGVAQMIKWNEAPRDSADFRRSWAYWANMHAHFGSTCSDNSPSSYPGMEGVQTFVAMNETEKEAWCKCEHGNNHFLTWHRMYLWYFERVLQAASNDPSLKLPFWDYATDPHLPAAYREVNYVNEAGQTVPNPLRVEARQKSLNANLAGLAEAISSATGAMRQRTFDTFSSLLENTPHGAIHCAVGVEGCRGGLMGRATTAALDPVFWAHHTNIDRLYECWLNANGSVRLPNDPTHLNKQYTFVDSDGSTVQRHVRDMLSSSQLGYNYEQGSDCPTATIASPAESAQMTNAPSAGEQSFTLAGPTRLKPGVTTVPISVPVTAREILSSNARGFGANRLHIVIEGLKYEEEQPGALYNVYLQGDGGRRELIGVINLFNFSAPHRHSATGRFEFDATEAMQRLAIGASAQPSLIFEPTTGLTDSSSKAATQFVSPEANLRFDSARIVIAP